MKNDRQVTFRRVKGRIVPIRKKELLNDPNVVKGSALLAGAGATAAAAGYAASRVVKEAASRRIRAMDVWNIGGGFSKGLKQRAAQLRGDSIRFRAMRKPILGIGSAIAGALAGAGTSYLLSSKRLRNELSDDAKAKLSMAATFAPLLTSAVYYKSLGVNMATAMKYAQAASKNALGSLPKLTIKTPLGPYTQR
jgi:hypothetical protein